MEEDDDLIYHKTCILKQAQYDFDAKIEKEKQVFADVTACNCTR